MMAGARPGGPILFVIGSVVDVIAHGLGASPAEQLDARLLAAAVGHA
jgi:hypothetical protein